MKLSQFSENQLSKDQMLTAKGGLQRIYKICRTLQPNGCYYISEGWSVERADGSWGWEEVCGCWEQSSSYAETQDVCCID